MKIYRDEAGEQAVKQRYREILDAWPEPHEEIWMETRHGRTFAVACGDPHAPPLLLFHGSGSNAVSWFGDLPILSRRHRVYAIDMIGEPGLSEGNRLAWSDPRYLEWVDDIFQSLNLTRAGLVGMSLGGWLALTYACARVERVSHLVLIAPGGLAPTRRSFMFKAVAYSLMGSAGRTRMERLIGWDRDMSGVDDDAEQQANTQKMMAFIQLINANFIFHREALPLLDDAQLRGLQMPVLMFFGERDALLNAPLSVRRLRQAVPDADIRLLPDTGHVILRQTGEIEAFVS